MFDARDVIELIPCPASLYDELGCVIRENKHHEEHQLGTRLIPSHLLEDLKIHGTSHRAFTWEEEGSCIHAPWGRRWRCIGGLVGNPQNAFEGAFVCREILVVRVELPPPDLDERQLHYGLRNVNNVPGLKIDAKFEALRNQLERTSFGLKPPIVNGGANPRVTWSEHCKYSPYGDQTYTASSNSSDGVEAGPILEMRRPAYPSYSRNHYESDEYSTSQDGADSGLEGTGNTLPQKRSRMCQNIGLCCEDALDRLVRLDVAGSDLLSRDSSLFALDLADNRLQEISSLFLKTVGGTKRGTDPPPYNVPPNPMSSHLSKSQLLVWCGFLLKEVEIVKEQRDHLATMDQKHATVTQDSKMPADVLEPRIGDDVVVRHSCKSMEAAVDASEYKAMYDKSVLDARETKRLYEAQLLKANADASRLKAMLDKGALDAEEAKRQHDAQLLKATTDASEFKAMFDKEVLDAEEIKRRTNAQLLKASTDASEFKAMFDKGLLDAEESKRLQDAQLLKATTDASEFKAMFDKGEFDAEEAKRQHDAQLLKATTDATEFRAMFDKGLLDAEESKRLHNAQLLKATTDASELKAMFDKGELDAEEAKRQHDAHLLKATTNASEFKAMYDKEVLDAKESKRLQDAQRLKATTDASEFKAMFDKGELDAEEAKRLHDAQLLKATTDATEFKAMYDKGALDAEEAKRLQDAQFLKATTDASEFKAMFDKGALDAEEAKRQHDAQLLKATTDASEFKAMFDKGALDAEEAKQLHDAQLLKATTDASEFKAMFDKGALDAEEAKRQHDAQLLKATTDASEFKAMYDKEALDAGEAKRLQDAQLLKATTDASEFKAMFDKGALDAEEAKRLHDAQLLKATTDASEFKAMYDKEALDAEDSKRLQDAQLLKATTDASEFKAMYDKGALDAEEAKRLHDAQLLKATTDASEFKAMFDKGELDAEEAKRQHDAQLLKATTDASEFKAMYDKEALDACEAKRLQDAQLLKATADASEFKVMYDKGQTDAAHAKQLHDDQIEIIEAQRAKAELQYGLVQETLSAEQKRHLKLQKEYEELMRHQEIMQEELDMALSNYRPKAVIDAGTPADKLLSMLTELLDGVAPSIQDILFVQSAIAESVNIYQPVNLGQQLLMVNPHDQEVGYSLMRQLGGEDLVQQCGMSDTMSLQDFCEERKSQQQDSRKSNGLESCSNAAASSRALKRQATQNEFQSCEEALSAIMASDLMTKRECEGFTSAPLSAPALASEVLHKRCLRHSGSEAASSTHCAKHDDLEANSVQDSGSLKGPKECSDSEDELIEMEEEADDFPCPGRGPVMSEVMAVLSSSSQWQFDAFKLNDVTEGHPLSTLAFYLMQSEGLIKQFNLKPILLARFLRRIEEGYQDNPYHNKIHAADVLQSMHVMMKRGGLRPGYADPLSYLGCLLAAVIHDFEHTGCTNDFLINNVDELALRYNDKAPLENHHLAASFMLMKQLGFNFLANMPKAEFNRMRKLIIELVLATDMKQHFSIVSHFTTVHRLGSNGSFSPSTRSMSLQDARHRGGRSESEFSSESDDKHSVVVPLDEAERMLSIQMALKCADLGHLTSVLPVHLRWVSLLEEEFFRQGDAERRADMPISPLFDRHKQGITKSQVGFFDIVVIPLFHAFTRVFPDTKPMLTYVMRNYKMWADQAKPAT